jgi:uracil permease
VLGLGGAKIPVTLGEVHLELHGMALAALVGLLANALLPESLDREEHDPHST